MGTPKPFGSTVYGFEKNFTSSKYINALNAKASPLNWSISDVPWSGQLITLFALRIVLYADCQMPSALPFAMV